MSSQDNTIHSTLPGVTSPLPLEENHGQQMFWDIIANILRGVSDYGRKQQCPDLYTPPVTSPQEALEQIRGLIHEMMSTEVTGQSAMSLLQGDDVKEIAP